MEDLGKLLDELDILKRERAEAFKRYNKYQKIVKKLTPQEKNSKNYSTSDVLMYSGAGAFLLGTLGLVLSAACKRLFISHYLSKPENADKLQDLFAQTGYDSVREVSTFLMGNDGVARVLFENCGAREYFLTNTLGISGTMALLGCASVCGPYAYKELKSRRYERANENLAQSQAEYLSLDNSCNKLETLIQDTIYNSWDEDNHWKDNSTDSLEKQ